MRPAFKEQIWSFADKYFMPRTSLAKTLILVLTFGGGIPLVNLILDDQHKLPIAFHNDLVITLVLAVVICIVATLVSVIVGGIENLWIRRSKNK